jgi:hypothetical protein
MGPGATFGDPEPSICVSRVGTTLSWVLSFGIRARWGVCAGDVGLGSSGPPRPQRCLLSRHMQRWQWLGSPTLQDLQLTISYATETEGRPWKTLRVDRSVVAIDWAT